MPTVDPYKAGMFKANPYAAKLPIKGKIVVVLDGKLEGRKLQLITPISRALCRHEIHELILTDEETAGPGETVDRIAYLGFFEVIQGGVMVVGDELTVGDRNIGVIAGFDETHMPNHLNIIIKTSARVSGLERGVQLLEELSCLQKTHN